MIIHFHLERKRLAHASHEAVHLFYVHHDDAGRAHRIGVADRVVPTGVATALEHVLRRGAAATGSEFTVSRDPRTP